MPFMLCWKKLMAFFSEGWVSAELTAQRKPPLGRVIGKDLLSCVMKPVEVGALVMWAPSSGAGMSNSCSYKSTKPGAGIFNIAVGVDSRGEMDTRNGGRWQFIDRWGKVLFALNDSGWLLWINKRITKCHPLSFSWFLGNLTLFECQLLSLFHKMMDLTCSTWLIRANAWADKIRMKELFTFCARERFSLSSPLWMWTRKNVVWSLHHPR